MPDISSSILLLCLANLRRRLNAILIFLVPIRTESSKFLYCLCSQTLTALPPPPFPPTLIPSGLFPELPKGDVPAVPTHLLPPSCLSFCSSNLFLNSSKSFSSPPNDLISLSSSSVSCFSNSFLNQSSGIRAAKISSNFSIPLKYISKALSNLS